MKITKAVSEYVDDLVYQKACEFERSERQRYDARFAEVEERIDPVLQQANESVLKILVENGFKVPRVMPIYFDRDSFVDKKASSEYSDRLSAIREWRRHAVSFLTLSLEMGKFGVEDVETELGKIPPPFFIKTDEVTVE